MKKTIYISAHYRSPEITKHNSVNIDHRHNSKHNFFSQWMCLRRTNKFKKPVHHPTSLRFSRMKSSNRHTCRLIFIFIRIRDMNNRYREASSWKMVIINVDNLWILFLDFFDGVHHVWVRIGNTVGEINVFVFFAELVSPRQTFFDDRMVLVWVPEFFAHESNVRSALFPLFFWWSETIWFHTVVIQKTTFLEIYQVKFNLLFMMKICYFEVKPSCMSLRIAINSHQKIVLRRIYHDC